MDARLPGWGYRPCRVDTPPTLGDQRRYLESCLELYHRNIKRAERLISKTTFEPDEELSKMEELPDEPDLSPYLA